MRNSTSRTTTLCVALAASLSACTGVLGDGDPAADSATDYAHDWNGGGGTLAYALDVSHWSDVITDAEVACWWDQGVRHVISGTQNLEMARQQLAMAYAGGMTIDLYVWLHWDDDITAQVKSALTVAADLPIGRLWLDVEQEPGDLSASQLEELLDEAVEACGSFDCGIYTGKWWWDQYLPTTHAYADLPLWYAHYDGNPSLASWSDDAFGGWISPIGKQYAEADVCGVTVDESMIVVYQAAPPKPEPPAAPADGPPSQPTGLYPDDGVQLFTNMVRVLCDTKPGATQYAFEVEFYASFAGAFRPYNTFLSVENAYRFHPVVANTLYRFRVSASNGDGASAASDWAWFEYGVATAWPEGWPPTEPPATEPPLDPPDDPPPQDPPDDPPPLEPIGDPPPQDVSPPGAPTNVLPAHGSVFSVPSNVTMSCNPVQDAVEYRFEIEIYGGSAWAPYFTYNNTAPTKTFYPASPNKPYRFRVQAKTGATWRPPSAWSAFMYGNGQWP